jgi:uncharacterized protein (DUF433 family)
VFERIAVEPQVCSGKPCIRGTRIMIKNILGLVAGGYDLEKILKTYPELEEEDIRQALDYVAFVVDDERVIAGG